ncbi:hypothetical protein MMC08_005078 [Hypocenomyce scalaris]|nr:hypothetical protein [Hypocenomyce scalaris]
MTSDFNTVMEYDGAADFYIADYGAYEAAYRDPYYVRVIEPDERNFVDKSETHVVKAQSTIGYNRSMILGGKANVEVGPQMRLWEEWEGRGKEEAEGGEEVKGGRKQ